MQTTFVNRYREINLLNTKKQLLGHNKCTVLVNGISGVGKSELTKKFIANCVESTPAIKVVINQAEKNAYSIGHYINKTASSLNKAAKTDSRLLTFEQYLRKNKPSSVVLRKIGDSFKEDLISNIPGGNSIKSIFDLLTGQSEFDEETVFTSTQSEPQFLLAEYILSECKRIPFILNIENIQSIDSFSLEQFIRIMSESNNCLFLLEFTQDDNSGFTISEIIRYLEDGKIQCDILDVAPLNIDEVKKIIHENPEVSWKLIQQSFVDWKGNLRPLVDIITRLKYGLIEKDTITLNILNGTKEHLESLPKNELLLLYLIYWHKEPSELNMLRRVVTFKEAFSVLYDVDTVLTQLLGKSLVQLSDQGVILCHDSIASELRYLKESSVYSLISQRFWLETYNELLNQTDLYLSKGHVLKKVLYYASCIEDIDRIYELLDLISYETLRSRDPEKMIIYVSQVKTLLNEQIENKNDFRLNKINLWLIELYYKLGKAKIAWEILQDGIHLKQTEIVLKAILLEQTGRHKEAIEYCNSYIPVVSNLNQELALRLVRLVTNYDIGNIEETTEEFYAIYNDSRYKICFEYGFLLRNAELVFSFKESLPYYKKSIAVFTKHNALRQAAFSRITYGVHLGLTGQFKKAKAEFRKANIELGDVISERHTLFNNLAVLNIFQQTNLKEAEDLLKQSMLTAEGDFERLTIHMNFLVIMDWMNKNSAADKAIESINKIIVNRTFASKEILLFAYFDIYKYYNERNDTRASSYMLKMQDIGIPNQPLWQKWLFNKPMNNDDELFFYGSINRAISFLCNWNMEYDSTLMHYE